VFAGASLNPSDGNATDSASTATAVSISISIKAGDVANANASGTDPPPGRGDRVLASPQCLACDAARLPASHYGGRDNNERRQCFHRQANEQPGAIVAFRVL